MLTPVLRGPVFCVSVLRVPRLWSLRNTDSDSMVHVSFRNSGYLIGVLTTLLRGNYIILLSPHMGNFAREPPLRPAQTRAARG